MNMGKLVFAQIMAHLPLTILRRCVARYDGEHKVKRFPCLDQYLGMWFAQPTLRESLCDIEACLRSEHARLYHIGLRSTVTRNTLANANAVCDWRIHAAFAKSLINVARKLYLNKPFGIDLANMVYTRDATVSFGANGNNSCIVLGLNLGLGHGHGHGHGLMRFA